MAYEIEAKLRVAAHEPIRARLRSLGGALRGDTIETDTLFDHSDGSLREAGVALRVRSIAAVDGPACGGALTVKGPVIPGAVKKREEIEFPVEDAKAAGRMLGLLQFVPVLTYQKRRETWTYRDCVVCLDEPPFLGLFVEIEGPSEEAVQKAQRELGLASEPHVRPSYAAMLSEYCERNGICDRVLMLSAAHG